MIAATRHIGIVVTDIEKALWFSRDVMGLKVAVDFRGEGEFIDTMVNRRGRSAEMLGSAGPLLDAASSTDRRP